MAISAQTVPISQCKFCEMSTTHSAAVAKNLYGCIKDNVGAISGVVLPRFNMECEGARGGGGGERRGCNAAAALRPPEKQ